MLLEEINNKSGSAVDKRLAARYTKHEFAPYQTHNVKPPHYDEYDDDVDDDQDQLDEEYYRNQHDLNYSDDIQDVDDYTSESTHTQQPQLHKQQYNDNIKQQHNAMYRSSEDDDDDDEDQESASRSSTSDEQHLHLQQQQQQHNIASESSESDPSYTEPVPSRTIAVQCDLRASSVRRDNALFDGSMQASSISSTRYGFYSYSPKSLDEKRARQLQSLTRSNHNLVKSPSLSGASLRASSAHDQFEAPTSMSEMSSGASSTNGSALDLSERPATTMRARDELRGRLVRPKSVSRLAASPKSPSPRRDLPQRPKTALSYVSSSKLRSEAVVSAVHSSAEDKDNDSDSGTILGRRSRAMSPANTELTNSSTLRKHTSATPAAAAKPPRPQLVSSTHNEQVRDCTMTLPHNRTRQSSVSSKRSAASSATHRAYTSATLGRPDSSSGGGGGGSTSGASRLSRASRARSQLNLVDACNGRSVQQQAQNGQAVINRSCSMRNINNTAQHDAVLRPTMRRDIELPARKAASRSYSMRNVAPQHNQPLGHGPRAMRKTSTGTRQSHSDFHSASDDSSACASVDNGAAAAATMRYAGNMYPLDYESQYRLNESGLPLPGSLDHLATLSSSSRQAANANRRRSRAQQQQQLQQGQYIAQQQQHQQQHHYNPHRNAAMSQYLANLGIQPASLSSAGPKKTMHKPINGRAMSQQSLTRTTMPSSLGRRHNRTPASVSHRAADSDAGGSAISLSSGARLYSGRYVDAHHRPPVVMYIPKASSSVLGVSTAGGGGESLSSSSCSTSQRGIARSSTMQLAKSRNSRSKLSLRSAGDFAQHDYARSLRRNTTTNGAARNGSDSETSSSLMMRTLMKPPARSHKLARSTRSSAPRIVQNRTIEYDQRNVTNRHNRLNDNSHEQMDDDDDDDDDYFDNVAQLNGKPDQNNFTRRYSVPKDAKINWFSKLKQRVISTK